MSLGKPLSWVSTPRAGCCQFHLARNRVALGYSGMSLMTFPSFQLFSIVLLLWGVVGDDNFAYLRFLRVFLDGRCGAKGIGRGLVHVGFLVFLFSASQSSDGFGSYCALRN